MNVDDTYRQYRYKTRVVAFIYDKSEYKEEVKQIKKSARYLSTRDNLRIGIVDDQRLVKKFKNKYGNKWFADVAMTSLVLKRYDGEFLNYDITSADDLAYHYFINKNSMK
jgi:hypothetical protein